MDNQSEEIFETSFRAFMTALFVGVADAFVCLIYNIIYRSGRPYFSSDIINVSYIIFGTIFLFSMIGLVYLLLLKLSRRGNLLFSALFAVLMIWALLAIHSDHFAADAAANASFRGELTGITIIVGASAVLGIPLLHGSRKFHLYIV